MAEQGNDLLFARRQMMKLYFLRGILLCVRFPPTLLDQLARGGRLVAPVGPMGAQDLVLIEKKADGSLRRRSVGPVAFVPMKPGGR